MRKFEIGGMTSDDDALEAKYKAAGLAASNAEKKSSGFLGLGRFLEGNIDQKGSEAYNKYGAGYGRKLEAENDRLKAATLRDTAAPAETKPAAPAASAPAAAAKYRGSSDYSDTADMKRNQGSAAATSAKPAAAATAVTKVVEDMPKTRPAGGAQVATGDARVAEYANAFPSSDMKRNQGSAAAKPPAAKPPAAKTTSPTQRGGREEDKAVPKAPADSRTAEAGNSRGSRAPAPAAAKAPAGSSPTQRSGREEDKAPAAAKAREEDKAPAAKAPEAAKQLSPAQQKAKDAIARATGNSSSSRVPTAAEAEQNRASFAGKAGDAVSSVGNYFKNFETPADRRSRLAKETKDKERSKFMKESGQKAGGGAIRGYASGGSVSASRRGDGIAQRGKTRGKMC